MLCYNSQGYSEQNTTGILCKPVMDMENYDMLRKRSVQ